MTEGSARKVFCVLAMVAFAGCESTTADADGEGRSSQESEIGGGSVGGAPSKPGCRLPAKIGKYEDELDSWDSLDGKGFLQAGSIDDGPSWVSTEQRLIYGPSHIAIDPDDKPFTGEYKPGKYAIPPREAKARAGVPPLQLTLWAYDADDSALRLEIYSSVSGDLVIESVDAEGARVRGYFENVTLKEVEDIGDDDLVPNGCQTHLERLDFTIEPRR